MADDCGAPAYCICYGPAGREECEVGAAVTNRCGQITPNRKIMHHNIMASEEVGIVLALLKIRTGENPFYGLAAGCFQRNFPLFRTAWLYNLYNMQCVG